MITSTSNSRVRDILRLQNRSKARRENGEFVVEGRRMVAEAPRDRLVNVYVSESFVNSNNDYIKTLDFPYEEVSDNVFAHMSDTNTPQGILAVVKMLEYNLDDILRPDNPLLLILENLQDPGNLGTIVRTSEGAGVSGIIMSPDTADIYNPKVIRSTMGSLYRMPFIYADDFQQTLLDLHSSGIKLYAACLEGSIEYLKQDYTTPCAIIIGNEGNGLTQRTMQTADGRIMISMRGSVQSVNAAVAAAVLMFEAKRQREGQRES